MVTESKLNELTWRHYNPIMSTGKFLDAQEQLSPKSVIWVQGYKTFFMLNSAEHEIFSANKYENANNRWHFHIF